MSISGSPSAVISSGITVRVNQGATTVETDPQWDTQYCDIDLVIKYRWGDCCKTSKITYDYNVGW